METRATPTSNDSRLSHEKRLHFILFVDAAQTRSFSLKTKHAWWLFASVLLFLVTSITTTFVLVKTYRNLKTTQSHLIDVKRELFAQNVAEGNILSPEFIGGGYAQANTEVMRSIVNELGQEPTTQADSRIKKESVAKSAEAQHSQVASIAAPSTSDLAPQKPADVSQRTTSVSPPKTQPTAAAESKNAIVLPPADIPAQPATAGSPIKFENIAVVDDDDEPGTINITFDLQNVSGRTLTGWVCAAVSLKNAEGSVQMRAAPSSVSLTANNQAITTCKGGEFVKFNRLRPTVLSTSGSQRGVEGVTVYFTDGTSGRQYAHKSTY